MSNGIKDVSYIVSIIFLCCKPTVSIFNHFYVLSDRKMKNMITLKNKNI